MEQIKTYKVAEIKLVYNRPKDYNNRPSAKSSKDAYDIFIHAWDKGNIEFIEEFKILFLNRRNKVLGIYQLSKGGTHATIVDLKMIVVSALKTNASQLIIAHNHPAGCLSPSENDINVTKNLSKACKLLDINLIDHLIITNDSYYSFADNGLL